MHFVRRSVLKLRLMGVRRKDVDEYRSILVIAPHPDDEIIGMGGHIIRQIRSGNKVCVVYLTDGEKSLNDIDPSDVARQRYRIAGQVRDVIGLSPDDVSWLHLPDGSIPRSGSEGFGRIVEQLSCILKEVAPEAVYVTHPLEIWPYDHIAAFELAEQAVRQSALDIDLYGYWVWLWYSMPLKYLAAINWNNIIRLPIRDVKNEKRALMDMYLKPAAPDGRPWSGNLPKSMLKAHDYPYEVVGKFDFL
jgi:LmbE family N-acetylglucosaminyl deacetylase